MHLCELHRQLSVSILYGPVDFVSCPFKGIQGDSLSIDYTTASDTGHKPSVKSISFYNNGVLDVFCMYAGCNLIEVR